MANAKPTRFKIIVVLFAVLIFAVMAGGAFLEIALQISNLAFVYPRDPSLRFLFAPTGLVLGTCLGLILHELGHALTALALCADVFFIQLGSGQKLARVRFAGFLWVVKRIPNFGAVHYGMRSVQGVRFKMFLITAGGPVISICLFGLPALAAYEFLNDSMLARQHPQALALLIGWTIGAFFILPGTLIPMRIKADGRVYASDALRLLTVSKMSDEHIEQLVKLTQLRREFDLVDLSPDSASALAERMPDNLTALHLALTILRLTNDRRALEIVQKLIAVPSESIEKRVEQLDTCLTVSLDLNGIHDLPNALTLVDELVSLSPNNPSTEGTRAAVLVDLGLKEGLPILRSLLESPAALNRCYSHIFLALAEKHAGNLEAARTHARAAKKDFPTCAALSRVIDLLPTRRPATLLYEADEVSRPIR